MRLLSLIIAFLFIGEALQAQERTDLDIKLSPLTRKDSRNQRDYGFILGLGQNFQGGEQYVDCPDCRFKGGAGFSFSIGMLYEYELFKGVRVGGQLIYNDFSFTSKFTETEMHNDIETGVQIPLAFVHEAKFSLKAITAAPYLKMYPWDFVYFRLGMPIAYIFSNNVKHDKALDSRLVSVGGIDYEIDAVKATVENGQIEGINNLQLFISTALGFDFKLARNVYLSPLLEYYIPFSEFSSHGSGSKINNWKLVFELRIALKEGS